MNQSGSHDLTEAEWRARFAVLQTAPSPNLARGRARVLAQTQPRSIPVMTVPRRLTLALALGIAVAVIVIMAAMSSAMGTWDVTAVALTRTELAQTLSPVVMPANALTRSPGNEITLMPARTPVPNLVPEPPRSPVLVSTRSVAP